MIATKTNLQYFKINLARLLQLIFSIIFLTSAFGKLIDLKPTILSIITLFPLHYKGAKFFIILLSILEILLVALIWKRKLLMTVLIFPLIFLCFILFSHLNGLNCGCFGSLPFFSQMSLGSHLLLLAGMILGIIYLINYSKHEKKLKAAKQTERQQFYRTSKPVTLAGYTALTTMLLAFLTLPFSTQNNNVINSSNNFNFVDRIFVQKTMSNDNTVIIDARPEFQYLMGHIPNSLTLPYNSTNLDSLIQKHFLNEKFLILYCSDSHCNAAEILARKLNELGCQKFHIYQGGWEDWIVYKKKTASQADNK